MMNKQIICINGVCMSGKDTFVSLCQNVFGVNKVWNYSSVDKVKEIALACGWDGEKTPAARKFLSDLKDLTENFCEMPYKSMCEKIAEFEQDKDAAVLFLHIREPEQIKRVQDNFGAKSMLVTRAGHNPDISNHADANVYNYIYDFHIKNDKDLEHLEWLASVWYNLFVSKDDKKSANMAEYFEVEL